QQPPMQQQGGGGYSPSAPAAKTMIAQVSPFAQGGPGQMPGGGMPGGMQGGMPGGGMQGGMPGGGMQGGGYQQAGSAQKTMIAGMAPPGMGGMAPPGMNPGMGGMAGMMPQGTPNAGFPPQPTSGRNTSVIL